MWTPSIKNTSEVQNIEESSHVIKTQPSHPSMRNVCQPQTGVHCVLAGELMFAGIKGLLNGRMNCLGIRDCVVHPVNCWQSLGVPKSWGDGAEQGSWSCRRYNVGLSWILEDSLLHKLGGGDDMSPKVHKTKFQLAQKLYIVRAPRSMSKYIRERCELAHDSAKHINLRRQDSIMIWTWCLALERTEFVSNTAFY